MFQFASSNSEREGISFENFDQNPSEANFKIWRNIFYQTKPNEIRICTLRTMKKTEKEELKSIRAFTIDKDDQINGTTSDDGLEANIWVVVLKRVYYQLASEDGT